MFPPVNPLDLEDTFADRLSDDPIRNGIHADQLLNDPLLKQCFRNVKQAYLKKFETIAPGDIESMKTLQLRLIAIADVQRNLLIYKFNGNQLASKRNDERRLGTINYEQTVKG